MIKRIIVGVTDASGSVLALETIRQLARGGVETHLVTSKSARMTITYEIGADGLAQLTSLANHAHSDQDLLQNGRHDRRAMFDADFGADGARPGRQLFYQGCRCRFEGKAPAGGCAA